MASHAVVTRLILNLSPPGPTRTRQVTRASGWRSRWRFGRPEVGCIVRAARPRAAREPRHALRRHRYRARGPRGDDRRLRADVRAGWGNPWIILALTVPLAIDWVYPLTFLRNEEGDNLQLHEVYSVIAMLLLPPLGVLAVFFMGTVCGLLVRRQSWIKAASTSVRRCCRWSSASRSSCSIDNGSPGEISVRAVLAAIAAALAMSAISQALVSLVICTSEGIPFWANLRDGLGLRFLQWVSAVSVGMLAALSAATYPWSLALAAVPLILVHVVLSEHLRARLDRERLDRLLRTAHARRAVERSRSRATRRCSLNTTCTRSEGRRATASDQGIRSRRCARGASARRPRSPIERNRSPSHRAGSPKRNSLARADDEAHECLADRESARALRRSLRARPGPRSRLVSRCRASRKIVRPTTTDSIRA